MVTAAQARADVDKFLLTKIIDYIMFTDVIENLAYESTTKGTSYTYSIKAQVTVQRADSKYVQDGIVNVGDLVGLFRYEYPTDAYGADITPTLVPKKGDRIVFNSETYSIKSITPATSEESGIIGWDFTAGQI